MISVQTKTKKVKVFIDASVLIAAAISKHGKARDLILAALRGNATLTISPFVLAETKRNLEHKAPKALPAFTLFCSVFITPHPNPSKALVLHVAKSVDSKDAPIVAGALAAKATHLATYDQKHLLSKKEQMKQTFGLIVATPDEILDVI